MPLDMLTDENFPDEEGTETLDVPVTSVRGHRADENFPDEEGTETFLVVIGADDDLARRELPRRRGD